jgi:hypothetical protein
MTLCLAASFALNAQTILPRDQAGPLVPATVFYKGQVAPVQARNAAGLRTSTSKLVLFSLVDTSGYSTAVQQTYQGYLLTEVAVTLGGKHLAPGAYGFGFVAGDQVVVLDLGANELLRSGSTREPGLSRPTPLQILADPKSPSHFRLYAGKSFVTLEAAAQ